MANKALRFGGPVWLQVMSPAKVHGLVPELSAYMERTGCGRGVDLPSCDISRGTRAGKDVARLTVTATFFAMITSTRRQARDVPVSRSLEILGPRFQIMWRFSTRLLVAW
jgi:hypothetical protein